MTRLKTFLLGTALAGSTFLAASAALAGPIANPGSLTASGDVKAVFAYADAADAADESELLRVGLGGGVIFDNKIDSVGTTKDVGIYGGLVRFELDDLSTGTLFFNDTADSGGNFHAKYGTGAADFGVTFSSTVNNAIAALNGPVILVGFEDRTAAQGSDFDYNDLIFAFSAVRDPVPEPSTVGILGASLIGLTLIRRRKGRA